MNISKSIQVCYTKFSTFSGRASRSEYWWFYLHSTVMGFLLDISDEVEKSNAFGDFKILVYLGLIIGYSIITIPLISAGSRRLHDIGKSGWWQLLALTIIGNIPLIVWMVRPGSREFNKYGPAIENI